MHGTEMFEDLMRAIIERGMNYHDEGGFEFKLHRRFPDAPRSPIKFNLATRKTRSEGRMDEDDMKLLGEELYEHCKRESIPAPALTGIPNVGQAIAEQMRYQVRHEQGRYIPLVPLTKTKHGIGPVNFPNEHSPGNIVLIIDDVATMADSAEEAVHRMRKAGYLVRDVLVVLDYGLGASARLAGLGVALHTLLKVQTVTAYAQRRKLLMPNQVEAVNKYFAAMHEYLKDKQLY